ncbi:Imm1 family immunity protein [Actinoplanes sp. NPDC023714]|uniref:Imm1 family immunity protein n=1 Tax=Actinoplanes sp. NPDC023714 TaxID=3154322 RepID=UPI0033E07972
MILAVMVGTTWRFIDPVDDPAGVVEEILDALSADASIPVAELTFTRKAWQGHDVDTDNHLFVSVNQETGFGALTWYVMQGWPLEGEKYEEVWVTDNPDPADADPRVVKDPHAGAFYHRRSALPLDRVRAALVEFCAAGTGDRPESVSWVTGRVDGWRQDEPYPASGDAEPVWNLPDNPWG